MRFRTREGRAASFGSGLGAQSPIRADAAIANRPRQAPRERVATAEALRCLIRLPWLYVAGSVGIGNIGRALAGDDAGTSLSAAGSSPGRIRESSQRLKYVEVARRHV